MSNLVGGTTGLSRGCCFKGRGHFSRSSRRQTLWRSGDITRCVVLSKTSRCLGWVTCVSSRLHCSLTQNKTVGLFNRWVMGLWPELYHDALLTKNVFWHTLKNQQHENVLLFSLLTPVCRVHMEKRYNPPLLMTYFVRRWNVCFGNLVFLYFDKHIYHLLVQTIVSTTTLGGKKISASHHRGAFSFACVLKAKKTSFGF